MDKHALDPACLLGDRLQTLSRAELTALAEALCRILAERGTYHGGIRPDNISRAADGTVGLGAPARTDTKDWTTEELEFMAPEVFWSGTRDVSADVYSIGLLLYAGVSGGRLPFYPDDRAAQPEDQAAALRRRMNGEPLPPARKAGRGLKEIIARATQCKPEDRYAAPAELCAALEQYDAEQRRSVPTAQEMFNKPEQELSDVERMMLAILTEEAAAPEPEPEPETPAEEPAAEEAPAEEAAVEEAPAEEAAVEEAPAEEAAVEEPAAEEVPAAPETAPAAESAPEPKPEPEAESAPEPKPEPEAESAPEPEAKPQPAPEQKPARPLPNKFRPKKQPARPETPARPQPERKRPAPAKKPEAYRPAPKKREPAEQRQSHKAAVLLTVLIICAAVLAVLLLRSLGVFGTPTTAEATPTPTVSVATPAPTETPTPTPTPKPEPTYEVVTADVSWADAEAAAEAKGGHLVVIDSAEKWTRVAQLADESGLTYVWIGLHRVDSKLAWVRDNVDPVYNWASGEPSVHDTNGAAEDYVLITRTADGWYYNDCIGDPAGRYPQFYSGKIGYIIEIDP
ncbi:MAG: lectin-like protein [Oscillospiraceae bacterium]